MMDPLGLALVVTLAGIGPIHLAWALGLNWAGTDPVSRAAFVVGTPNRDLLEAAGGGAIAASCFAAVGVVWITQQPIIHPLRALVEYGGYVVLIAVFGLRGLRPTSPAPSTTLAPGRSTSSTDATMHRHA